MKTHGAILKKQKLGTLGAATIAAFVSSVPLPLVTTVSAQSQNAAAACMVRSSADGTDLTVVVPANNKQILRKKGFKPVPCAKVFASQSSREAYRDAICQLSSGLDQEKQGLFEAARGERPSVLCGMAELAVGQWKRKVRR